MRRTLLLTLIFGSAAGIAWLDSPNAAPVAYAAAQPVHDEDSRLTVRDQETIRKTFDLGAGPHSIEIDNVEGFIEVVGADSNQVTLSINKTIRAESQAKLEEARKEVTLEVTHNGGSLKLLVDGPFRCNCNCGDGRRWSNFRGHEGYRVRMDFQLQVPRNIDFRLLTVNSGHIKASDLRGRYSVHNVNGGIELLAVAGSGTAHTVNGGVKVTFHANPAEPSSFESVNGDIDLYFVRGLSADFRFKTFNGNVYSDFEMTSLPVRALEKRQEGAKTIFRTDRFTGGRVGSGGVEIRTENLNGDIRIRENHE